VTLEEDRGILVALVVPFVPAHAPPPPRNVEAIVRSRHAESTDGPDASRASP
jgi:hypothetical protein